MRQRIVRACRARAVHAAAFLLTRWASSRMACSSLRLAVSSACSCSMATCERACGVAQPSAAAHSRRLAARDGAASATSKTAAMGEQLKHALRGRKPAARTLVLYSSLPRSSSSALACFRSASFWRRSPCRRGGGAPPPSSARGSRCRVATRAHTASMPARKVAGSPQQFCGGGHRRCQPKVFHCPPVSPAPAPTGLPTTSCPAAQHLPSSAASTRPCARGRSPARPVYSRPQPRVSTRI